MRTFYLLLFLSLTAAVCAQREYANDAQLWTHLDLEAKLSKRFAVQLKQQYRFGDNVGYLTRGNADLGLSYKLDKYIRLEGYYRYIQKRKSDGHYAARHWFGAALVLKKDINRFRFVYRNLVQFRNDDINSYNRNQTKIFDRNKLTVKYEATKRLTFYVSGEVYIPLNNPQQQGIERMREAAGLLFTTFKDQQLELFFMYKQKFMRGGWWDQYDKKYPSQYYDRYFIYGIGYNIEF